MAIVLSELFESASLTPERWAQLASALVGLAVAWLCWSIISIVARTLPADPEAWDYEQRRRASLRQGSALYRGFEPLVDEWISAFGDRNTLGYEQIQRNLVGAAVSLPWKPQEFLAVAWLEGLLTALAMAVFGWQLGGIAAGVVAGVACAWFYPRLKVNHLAKLAAYRKRRIKKRLPFCLDLLALTMEAGASFLDSTKTVLQELGDEPLGVELDRAMRELALGRSRREALEALRDRVTDEDVAEMVFAINKGEELGTPLSRIFRVQADQMRLKRSQWAEKTAGDAQVTIVFPGMLTMVACLLVVVTPFILGALQSGN